MTRMNNRLFDEAARLLAASVGIMLLALSINYFSWKFLLVSGGFPGYALDINYLSHFPVGTFLLILNTIVLVLSFFIAGKTAGLRGVYGYVFLSFFIDWSKTMLHIRQTPDPLLFHNVIYTILQGATAPAAIALVMANGYSFGSYSSVMPIIRKFSSISAPRFFLIMDSILALLTFFLFGLQRAVLMYVNAGVFFVVFRKALPFAERKLSIKSLPKAKFSE